MPPQDPVKPATPRGLGHAKDAAVRVFAHPSNALKRSERFVNVFRSVRRKRRRFLRAHITVQAAIKIKSDLL